MTRTHRNLAISAVSLALLLVAATFPMRLALALSGAGDAGIAAREVRGSVWSGDLVEARLGALPLGTVSARLSPLALLAGDVRLAFARRDERLGPLSGRLHGSSPRGLSDVNGVATLAGGLGVIPVDALRFEGATVRFAADGACAQASGRLHLSVAAPIAGLDLSHGLSGPLRCAGGKAQAALASQSGMERLTLNFDGNGVWRAQLAISVDNDPAMAAALTAMGFGAGQGGYMLTTNGHF